MNANVDPSQDITHISLCAGYGGIDLGLKRAIGNLRTVAFSEIEAFACSNLVSKMEAGLLDSAPIWTNLKTFPWQDFRGKVDILSGGYPCQPFSAAGKRAGKDDPRHLWPYIADGIRILRPSVCFFENVEGHISLGLSDVIEDLASMGYRTTWGIFSAVEVGAPHRRKRVFILAHRIGEGLERYTGNGDGSHQPGRITQEPDGHAGAGGLLAWPSRPGEPQHEWEPPRVVGDGNRVLRSGESKPQARAWLHGVRGRGFASGGPDDQRQAQPEMGGDPDGPAGRMGYAELQVSCDNRTDELRLLGNGVVPATAHKAFLTLIQEFTTNETITKTATS
jgi:DNA (cytosine-5)-methyltransferase 1